MRYSEFTKFFGKVVRCLVVIGIVGLVAGAIANTTIVVANHGKMPVISQMCKYFPDAVLDAKHVCAGPKSHLLWLADRFRADDMIYSPGDFLIFNAESVLTFIGIGYFFKFTYRGIKKEFQRLSTP